ncbi:MAG: isochorismatase family protein [Desulfatiglandales bacterium]
MKARLRNLIKEGDGLLLVDIQPDFFAGSRLAVSEGDQIIPVINAWIAAARDSRIPVYATRDWKSP